MKSWISNGKSRFMLGLGKTKMGKKSHGADCLECGISISEGCLAQVKQIFHQERCGCI